MYSSVHMNEVHHKIEVKYFLMAFRSIKSDYFENFP